MIKIYSSVLILSLVLLLSGCGKKDAPPTTDNKTTAPKSNMELVKLGKDLFYNSMTATNLKCADCHSDGTNDANPLVKFHSNIRGADKRTSTYLGRFKGDDVKKNAAGATVCWEQYLKFKDPMNAEQIAALNAYYESVQWNEPAKDMIYTSTAVPQPDREKLKKDQEEILKMTGDKAKGEKLFNDACKFCHAEDTKIKNVPSLFKDFEGNPKSIAFMSRMGKKYMPFYSYEALSNQDLADIASYIMGNQGK